MMHRTDICVRNKCCSISCRDMRSKEEWRKKREQSRFSARNHWNLSVNRYHTFYITLCVHHSMWLRKSSCSWTVYYIVVVIFHAVDMFIFCCVLQSSIFFVLVLLLRLVCFKILVVLSTNWHLFSVLLHVLDTYAIFRIEFCIQLIAIGNFLNYIHDWELFSANYFQWIMQFSNQLYGFFSSFLFSVDNCCRKQRFS